MNALLIQNGAISRIVLGPEPNHHEIHRLVGDFFSTCFNAPGAGAGRMLIGYCDDNYFRKPGPWNVILGPSLYRVPWPVRGPIVVTAGVPPDTVSMSEQELAAFAIDRTFVGQHAFTFTDPWDNDIAVDAPFLNVEVLRR